MMIQKPTKKPISRNYAVKSDDDPKNQQNQYPGAMLSKAMMIQKPTKKPISRNYAVKSDDDPKTNKKPISRNYAVKSDDDPKNQIIHSGRFFIQIFQKR